VPDRLQAELVVDVAAELGESPYWDCGTETLHWVDMAAGRLHSWERSSGRHVGIDIGVTIGACVPRAGEGMALAVEDGFAVYDGHGALRLVAGVIANDPGLRMNDGKCDAAGRFYASSMSRDGAPGRGALWRLDPDLQAHRLRSDVTIGNGLAWSADGHTAFFIDTATRRVDRLTADPETGDLHDRSVAFEIPAAAGSPDGMCIDDEGCLWVALFGGGAVHRYRATGELLSVVELPPSNATSVAFGGPALDELYITTARLGRDEPGAGGVFVVRPGVTGPPPEAFAG
jgi:sugar lactone lactonase YvrE